MGVGFDSGSHAQESGDAASLAKLAEIGIDPRTCGRDLLQLIGDVDRRMRELFEEAFRDVAAGFSELFAELFPGGEGRLVLTDPADPLASGVERLNSAIRPCSWLQIRPTSSFASLTISRFTSTSVRLSWATWVIASA